MADQDIRWIQRLSNYKKKALNQLTKFIDKGKLNELEEQGLIQAFEYTHELAWKTLKDYLNYQGINDITDSRDATREAFNNEIIANGEVWMEMIKNRNETSHTYNEETTEKISENIVNSFYNEFLKLQEKLSNLEKKNG